MSQSPTDKFWFRVQPSSPDAEACWTWTGTQRANGYGELYFEGRMWKAHRLAYTLAVGPIPDGLDIDHLCRNRLCVRPDHLEPVTRSENLTRGMDARRVDRTRVCVHGHVGHMRRKKATGAWECGECVRAYDRRRGQQRGKGQKGAAGERHYKARLSAAQVEEIRRRVAAGESQADMVRAFGVSGSTVWSIVHGLHWRSVD